MQYNPTVSINAKVRYVPSGGFIAICRVLVLKFYKKYIVVYRKRGAMMMITHSMIDLITLLFNSWKLRYLIRWSLFNLLVCYLIRLNCE